jgi:2-polyprenyl-6-methoxyphenol hydroxylase-like FAD-dependent oxidoreductase
MTEKHAVVVGGSMAGLLAARVLADRADQVVIVERDELPESAADRKGVPQGRHAHGLLPAGDRVLRDLFPGMLDELVAAGAQRVTSATGRWWQGGGYRVGTDDGLSGTFFSRPFLEAAVRARVLALTNVTLVSASAKGLCAVDGRVVGLDVEEHEHLSSLRSDLVVDATGRGSAASRWLEAIGYEPPPVDQVRMDVMYATRFYRRTPGRVPDGSWFVSISDPPAGKRIGVAFPVEGDRWIVTIAGYHGDHPSTDEDANLAFARSLPSPDIAGIFEHEQALTPIVTHRMSSSQWRHYDKLRRHPSGFLALGDSICSFNPVYGQGMSSAAQQAVALGGCIDAGGGDVASTELWKRFYKRSKKVIANPWSIAAGADFQFPETTGPKPPGTDVINRYVGRVVLAAQRDGKVADALWDVQGLLSPPPSLMKPAMALRVLRTSRKGPVGAAGPAPAPAAPAAAPAPAAPAPDPSRLSVTN